MKKNYLFDLARTAGTLLIGFALSISALAYPSGAPAGYTGSPGDGSHCVSCHGGSAVTVSAWITSNIPATGYIAGTMYNITATVTGTGKKGFEVSPQNATGTQLGVLAAGTNNHLVGGTKYVTHNSAGSTSGTSIYNFTWTAPAAGTGTVTFYGAFCVGKSNTKLSTMVVDENGAVPLSATASAVPALVCAGQSSQLNVVPAGGSGNYTYSWSSVPPGFTSSLQNPVVAPSVSTQYVAHVSDGAFSADAPVNVSVNQPATAFAGNDTTCAFLTTQIPLNGSATGYSTVLWTTSGTGTFSAANSLAGSYFPGTADKSVGTVTLTLTAMALAPCTAAATGTRVIHFDGPTGMTEQNGQISIVISPNPTHGLFKIRLSGPKDKNATITVSDITGKILIRKTVDTLDNRTEQFDMTGIPGGLYLVKIQTDNQSMVRKLVVE